MGERSGAPYTVAEELNTNCLQPYLRITSRTVSRHSRLLR